MSDLEKAKKQLFAKHAAMVMVKDGYVVFETSSHRISGFLEAIDRFSPKLKGASVADRVAGKAVALLCVFVGAKAIYADVMSKKAKTVFNDNEIACEWKELVDNILDLSKSKLCPFEERASSISDPRSAYEAFRKLQKTLSSKI